MINLLLPLQEPFRLIESVVILSGLWMNMKLAKMAYYQYKYGGEAGEDYINMTKLDFHRKYTP